jgi:hypothetical protein
MSTATIKHKVSAASPASSPYSACSIAIRPKPVSRSHVSEPNYMSGEYLRSDLHLDPPFRNTT